MRERLRRRWMPSRSEEETLLAGWWRKLRREVKSGAGEATELQR